MSAPFTSSRRQFLKTSSTLLATTAVAHSPLKAFGTVNAGENEYDFIVIGSGAGGGPVACNLAKAGFSVLLLEAGGTHQGVTSIVPAFHTLSTEDPEMAWNFFVKHYSNDERAKKDSKYVANANGKNSGGIFYPRAGTLGGCTTHNAMITLYPENRDFDDIAALTQDRSWNAKDMRTYYDKVSKWLPTEQTSPLLALEDEKLTAQIAAAAEAFGLSAEQIDRFLKSGLKTLNPNQWQNVIRKIEGLYLIPKATFKGRRIGTRELILNTAYKYSNLKIQTGALVSKLVFSDTDKTQIIGAEYYAGRHLYEADPSSNSIFQALATKKFARAKKEVIVAGGAFNSPQILMLSGIGDPTHLEAVGIECKHALTGVGKNLQDRYEVGVVTALNSNLAPIAACTFNEGADPCLEEYKKNPEKSIYSTNGVVLSILKKSSPELAEPDLCIFGTPGAFRGYYPGYSRDVLQKDGFTWAVLKGHTQNRGGTVKLLSSSAFSRPEINFNYFSEGSGNSTQDLNAVLEGFKLARRIGKSPFVRATSKGEVWPSNKVKTDADAKEFIQNEAWGHHASCSNKMGPSQDSLAVVDSNFKVHGLKGLRIVDASIFPRIPGLFIALPIYMVSEKASEVILKEHSST